MPEYITVEVETEPVAIVQEIYSYLQSRIPGWTPADGNLDVWLIEAFSEVASDIRDLASQVPDSIFRYFGANIAGIAPLDAMPATATTTWTMKDNLGYTIAAGTQVGIRNTEGDLVPFVVQTSVTIPEGQSSTAAGAVTIIAVNPGADGSSLGTTDGPVELIDQLEYVTSITQIAATSGGQDAELDDAYLNRLRTRLALLTPTPVLPADFAILARDVAGVYRTLAIDGYNPFHNLLTANGASIETDASYWTNDTNCAVARSTAQAADGLASLSLTSSAGGDMKARQATQVAVIAGDVYTALASFRAATTGRSCRVSIRWYSDSGGTTLISTTDGNTISDINTNFLSASVQGTAPANALSARIVVSVLATGAASEVHYVDKLSWRRGTDTDWVAGGTAETGNTRTVAVAMTDENGAAVSTAVKNAVSTYLQGLREVNFVVKAVDAQVTSIDVSVTVKVLPGYASADVAAAVTAALQDYLSPLAWGIPQDGTPQDWVSTPTVRYLEVAEAINRVSGVDYITSTGGNFNLQIALTGQSLARQDLSLPGAAPLVIAGTLTVSAAV